MHLSGASRVRAERVPYCFVTPASPTSPNYSATVLAERRQRSALLRNAPTFALRGLEYITTTLPRWTCSTGCRSEARPSTRCGRCGESWSRGSSEDAGLLEADQQRVDLSGGLKAHATLLNSRWRRQGGRRESFDARPRHQTHGS